MCLLSRDVDSLFLQGSNYERIERTGLEAGALGEKAISAELAQIGFRHLASRTVVRADEQYPDHENLLWSERRPHLRPIPRMDVPSRASCVRDDPVTEKVVFA